MYSQIVSMLEAGTCPSKVVNTLRIKYAKDSQKVLEVPGASVVRNLLRGLRFTNPVISRKIKELQISDYVGSSELEESPALAQDIVGLTSGASLSLTTVTLYDTRWCPTRLAAFP